MTTPILHLLGLVRADALSLLLDPLSFPIGLIHLLRPAFIPILFFFILLLLLPYILLLTFEGLRLLFWLIALPFKLLWEPVGFLIWFLKYMKRRTNKRKGREKEKKKGRSLSARERLHDDFMDYLDYRFGKEGEEGGALSAGYEEDRGVEGEGYYDDYDEEDRGYGYDGYDEGSDDGYDYNNYDEEDRGYRYDGYNGYQYRDYTGRGASYDNGWY